MIKCPFWYLEAKCNIKLILVIFFTRILIEMSKVYCCQIAVNAKLLFFFKEHSVWLTKMIHQTESTFTRPKENRIFFNISLLMAGLYSFLYLYKALFIVIDFNYGCFLISYTHVIWNQQGEEWYGNKNFHNNIYSE